MRSGRHRAHPPETMIRRASEPSDLGTLVTCQLSSERKIIALFPIVC